MKQWTGACASLSFLATFIASCASREVAQNNSAGDRAPASLVMPRTMNNYRRSVPVTATNAAATPANPNGQPYVPAPAASPSPTPTSPADPNHGGGNPGPAPTPQPSDAPEQTACLSQVLPGTSFTIQNILAGLKLRPGVDVITRDIRTGRASIFYIDWNNDPDQLRPIFQTEVQAGSDFHRIAQNSESFKRAISFVSGTGHTTGKYSPSDYIRDGKLAWIMAILIANKGDRECVRYVLNDSDKIVGPQLAADLRNLPFLQAAQLVSDNQIGSAWQTLEDQRIARVQMRQEIEIQKQTAEIQHQAEMADLAAQLDAATAGLKSELSDIPECADKISKTSTGSSLEAFRRASGLKPEERASNPSTARMLIAACKMQIYSQLSKLHQREIALRATLARQTAKRKKDGDTDPSAQESETMDKLTKVKGDTEQYQAYLERLSMDVDSSLGTQLDEITRLQGEQRTKSRANIYGDLLQQQKDLEQAEKKDSGAWLVNGVFSGWQPDPTDAAGPSN